MAKKKAKRAKGAAALIAAARDKRTVKMPPVAAKAELAALIKHNDSHADNYGRVSALAARKMLADDFGFPCSAHTFDKIVETWFGRRWGS